MTSRRALLAGAGLLAAPATLRAQPAWPNDKPVEIIVPFPAGGGVGVLEAIGTDSTFTSKYGSNGCPDKGATSMFTYAKNKGMDWGVIGTLRIASSYGRPSGNDAGWNGPSWIAWITVLARSRCAQPRAWAVVHPLKS